MCRIINYLLDHKYATVRWRKEIIDNNDYSVEIHTVKISKIDKYQRQTVQASNIDPKNNINDELKCIFL